MQAEPFLIGIVFLWWKFFYWYFFVKNAVKKCNHPVLKFPWYNRPEKYHLFEHNCNTFSAEAAVFLTGNKIPQHIQDLPSEVLNT